VYKKLRIAESILLDLRLCEKAKNEGVDYHNMTIGSKMIFGSRMVFDDALDDKYKYNKESEE